MILMQSPNIFQGMHDITEPMTVPNGDQRKPPGKNTAKKQMADDMDMSTEKQSLRRPFRQE